MESYFLRHIKSFVSIPQEQADKFRALVSTKQVRKGDCFLREGELSRTIAFVKSGLFRYYYNDREGNELTKGFFVENSILVSFSAIFENRGSHFSIQALEDSDIETIDYQKSQLLAAEHPCWNAFLVRQL